MYRAAWKKDANSPPHPKVRVIMWRRHLKRSIEHCDHVNKTWDHAKKTCVDADKSHESIKRSKNAKFATGGGSINNLKTYQTNQGYINPCIHRAWRYPRVFSGLRFPEIPGLLPWVPFLCRCPSCNSRCHQSRGIRNWRLAGWLSSYIIYINMIRLCIIYGIWLCMIYYLYPHIFIDKWLCIIFLISTFTASQDSLDVPGLREVIWKTCKSQSFWYVLQTTRFFGNTWKIPPKQRSEDMVFWCILEMISLVHHRFWWGRKGTSARKMAQIDIHILLGLIVASLHPHDLRIFLGEIAIFHGTEPQFLPLSKSRI